MRQKRKILMTFAVLIFCIGGLGSNADAALIAIEISGQVTELDDGYNNLQNQIHVGDTVTGTYTYDSTTSDSNPMLTVGEYWHDASPTGIYITISEFVFQTNPNDVDFVIGVNKNTSADYYGLLSYNNLPLSNGTPIQEISWQLDDSTRTALSSDALPLTAPDLSKWNDGGLSITGPPCGSQYYVIAVNITSAVLVPEPATLFLLSCGLWFTRRLSK